MQLILFTLCDTLFLYFGGIPVTEKDQLFLTSKQPQQKLEIAVTRYFCDQPNDTELQKQYRNFLRPRAFSALQWILHHSTAEVLSRLLDTGWLSESSIKRGLEEDDIPIDLRILLIRSLNPSAVTPVSSVDYLTSIQLNLFKKFPHLRFAISGFHLLEDHAITLSGTDGENYYYNQQILETFKDPIRDYFHSIIHCLWLHIQIDASKHERYWNLAADIAAAYLLDELLGIDQSCKGLERHDFYVNLPVEIDRSSARSIYHHLQEIYPEPQLLFEPEALFQCDDHSFWYKQSGRGLHKWKRLNGSTGNLFTAPVKKRFGLTPGSRMDLFELRKEAKYDFHSYLQRFTVTEEELQTDLDTFDYIPYMYGLKTYGNLPLIEPLEYTDASKVEELVIAIDTSGSCDEQIVQQFLAETRRILTDRRNFFRRMNVHIIQCDSMIQDHVKIESVEDWNRYISNIRIIGRGGTDFTPVFAYTEKLIAKGELRHLKGLLYFTDGDGVYPKQAPPYETAFVFTDKRFLEFPVPDWAVCLCLNLNQGEHA